MLLFFEGFETYGLGQARSALDDVYNFTAAYGNEITAEIVASTRSISTQALSAYNPEVAGDPRWYQQVPLAGLSSEDDWVFGMAMKDDDWTAESAVWPIVEWRSVDGDRMLTLSSNSSGDLTLRRGQWNATEIDSAAGVLGSDWQYLEFKVKFHGSAGSYEIRLDETTVMSDSGVNTTATGDTRPYEIAIAAPRGAKARLIDDIYILDDQAGATGNEATDFLGAVQVMRVRPNAVGDSSDFDTSAVADNYTLVDEDQEDDDSSYVETTTANAIDLYHYEDIADVTTETISTIHGVMDRAVLKKADGGTRTYRLLSKSGATTGQSGTRYPSTTYVRQSYIWETDPDTSTQFTVSGFNAAQFGQELLS